MPTANPTIYTAAMLKVAIAGFLQREPTTFLRGTLDLLLVAINNARMYAERMVDFERARQSVDIPNISITDGGPLSGAVAHGTATAVNVKKILTPYITAPDGTVYPIDLWTKASWTERIKRRFERVNPIERVDSPHIWPTNIVQFVLVQDNQTLFIVPANTAVFTQSPFTIYADVIGWLTPYVDGTETDFLLQYCFDWMMYRAIFELNHYLKEDERVEISSKLMTDSWNAVVKWNNELLLSSADDQAQLD